jgi:hypothetical protein
MSRLKAFAAFFLTVFALPNVASPTLRATQAAPLEYQVKAAFLFNFSKFVQWPEEAFARKGSPFTICLAGDPFAGALDAIVQNETVDGRKVIVRRITEGGVQECSIVFVGRSEARHTAEIISAAGKSPILTVGESEDFIDKGGMIRFIERERRIRFQINTDAAERASLKISAKLLQLADIVRPR